MEDLFQEQWVEGLFNQFNRAVMLLNHQGEIAYLNPAAERLWTVSLNSAKGKPIGQILRNGDRFAVLVLEVLTTGRTLKVREFQLASPQGPLPVELEMAPIGLSDRPAGVLILLEELSTLQALQEENRMSDRLSMMGTLASGLAHEIRNPLGGIRAAAEMLKREAKVTESKEYATMIISEVDRVNHLVTQLLDFAKPKKLKKQRLNINQLLDELFSLQSAHMKKLGVQVRKEFDPSLPPVFGSADSLKQAFLNLIKNALEAMEQGGTLKVSTSFFSNTHLSLGEKRSGTGHMALVKISDTGPGIEPEHLSALFTPFFTTKAQGTGLGLMMTQRIIREHEGLLKVQTQLKSGSTFSVFLKLAK